MADGSKTREELLREVDELRRQLAESRAALDTRKEVNLDQGHGEAERQAPVNTPEVKPGGAQAMIDCPPKLMARSDTPLKILLIEDNPADARLVQEMLTDAGGQDITIEWVPRLSQGLGYLGQHQTDLVLLDLSLPDSQGLETFCKAYTHAPEIPFVLLTGLDDETLALTAVQKGAQDYLIKGKMDGYRLFRAVRYASERKRAQEALQRARDELEHRVEARTAGLVAANQQLQEKIAQHRQAEAEQQGLLVETQSYSEELRISSEELKIQGEELRIQNETLHAQAEELEYLTEKLQTERNLQQAVLEQMPAGVIIAEPSGRIILTNHRAEAIWGQAPGSLRDLKEFQQIPRYFPDGRAYSPEGDPLGRALTLGETVADEVELLERQDGDHVRRVYLNVNAIPVRDQHGSVIAAVATYTDITARKQAQAALRQSEERYRSLVELSPDAILVHVQGKIVFVNPAAVKLFGATTRNDLVGQPVMGRMHPDYRDAIRDRIRTVESGHAISPQEEKILRLDGEAVEVEAVGGAIIYQGRPAVQVVFRDITERNRAREALKAANAKLQALIEASPLAIVHLDRKGTIQSCNPATERIFGWQAEELLGRFLPVESKAKQKEVRNIIQRIFQGEPLTGLEVQGRRKDGTWIDVSLSGAPLYGETGEVTGIVGLAEDITARKQTETALAQSRAKFEAIFNSISDAIIFADSERHIILANPAVRALFGYDPDELFGKSAALLYADPGDFETMGRRIYHVGSVGDSRVYEVPYRRKDGTIFQGETVGGQVKNAQGNILGFVGIHRNITARKVAEAALKESQRQVSMLADFLENSSQPFGVGFLDGRIGMFNESFLQLLGYSQKELSKLNWQKDLTPPEWREKEATKLEELQRTGQPVRYEKEYLRRDGTRVPVEMFVHLRREGQGQPLIFYAFVTDITARKRDEASLKESEERYRSLFEKNHAVMLLIDPETGAIVDANPAACSFYGLARAKLTALKITDLNSLPPEQVFEAMHRALNDRQRRFQFRHRLAGGEIRDVEVYSGPIRIKGQDLLYSIIHDITARKEAEAALVESEARFRAIFEGAAIGIALTDTAGRILAINPAFEKSLGYCFPDLCDKTFADLTHVDDRQMSLEHFEDMMAGGRDHYHLEKRYICKDGSVMWGNLAVSLIRDAAGAPAFAMGMIEDITARKATEEALRTSEAEIKSIFRVAPVGIGVVVNRVITTANAKLCEMVGYRLEKLIGQSARMLYPTEEEFEKVGLEKYLQIAEHGTGTVETLFRKKDGTLINVLLSSTPINLLDLEQGVTFTALDITERKQAVQALEQERQRLFALLDELPGFIFLHDENYSIRFTNRRCREIFGEPQNRFCYTAFHQRQTPCERCPAAEVFATQTSQEWEQTLGDGRTFQVYKYPFRDMDGTPCVLSLGLDITARKQAEEALRKQAELLDLAHDAIIVRDLEARIVFWSRGAEETYGWTKEQAKGQIIHTLLKTTYPIPKEAVERQLLEKGKWHGELAHTRADGTVLVVASRWALQRDDAGEPSAILEINRDITGRKQAEEALRESEARFRQLAENLDDAILLASADLRLVHYISPAFERIWGRSCASLYQEPRSWLESLVPEDQKKVRTALKEVIAGNLPLEIFPEFRIIRPDGAVRWILARFFPIRNKAGEVYRIAGTATDITSRKEMEAVLRWRQDHLQQTAKMEAVGRLAGGVAHDFNNLLTVISGYGELLLADLQGADQQRRQVQAILKAADQATVVTRQLLAFSRKQMLQPQILDLNGLIASLVEMFRRLADENIRISMNLEPKLGAVKADAGHIEQVIMNLAINAMDAMPQGGALTIETANVQVTHEDTRRHPEVTPGAYVMVTVSDTGIGMNQEILSHIFEPFFTTKEREKGTGLGLSMAYGIVKQSGGHILVESTPQQGSIFRIYLPRASKTKKPVELAALATASPDTGTILLVEDEAGVRHVVQRMLALKGYSVLTAYDGQEALQIGQGHPGPIHLLLTDVAMPVMGGRELAQRLAPAHPEMKVLFMSGHTEDGMVRRGVRESVINFIQKPFRADQLLHKVRKLLAQPKP